MDKEKLIDLLIITAHSWGRTGQTNDALKSEFDGYMKQLQAITGTDWDGAMNILLVSQSGKGDAA